MDFSFTDEQQQLRRTVREFAENGNRAPRHGVGRSLAFPSEIIPKAGANSDFSA